MSYSRNSRSKVFRSNSSGTYPVNDGNPENDDEDFDEEELENDESDFVDYQLMQMEERE